MMVNVGGCDGVLAHQRWSGQGRGAEKAEVIEKLASGGGANGDGVIEGELSLGEMVEALAKRQAPRGGVG